MKSLIIWPRANLIHTFSESSAISISQYELPFVAVETLPQKEDIPEAYSRMQFQVVFTAKGEKTKNDATVTVRILASLGTVEPGWHLELTVR